MPRMTSKGQVTIPVTVRYALGIAPGDEVVFAVEDGRGVFRRATGAAARAGALALPARAGAHPLEQLLAGRDDAFATSLEAARSAGERVDVPDVVVLDVLRRALLAGLPAADVAECLRDVVADRVLRLDHARAVRTAIDAAAAGDDPLDAYAVARG